MFAHILVLGGRRLSDFEGSWVARLFLLCVLFGLLRILERGRPG